MHLLADILEVLAGLLVVAGIVAIAAAVAGPGVAGGAGLISLGVFLGYEAQCLAATAVSNDAG